MFHRHNPDFLPYSHFFDLKKNIEKHDPLSRQADEDYADHTDELPRDYVSGKRSSPFPTEIGGTSFSRDQGDTRKRGSLQAMRHHAQEQINKLQKQADLLVRQAGEIKNRMTLAEKIGGARYNFRPVLLKTYYLYQKPTGNKELILTLIGPEEWNGTSPYGKLLAKVRQLGDSTWETLDLDPD